MSLHTWCRQGPRKPSSCATSRSTLTGQSCHRRKKSSISASRVPSVVSNSLQPCGLWPARLLCQGGGSPGKNTGVCWPIPLPCPSRALCFLLPSPPAPLSIWCCQNRCDPSSCTTSTRGPHGANPSPPGQPQEQTPGEDPDAEVEIKPQMKPRGSVTKEEDPKPSHLIYKLYIKFD